VNRVYFAAVVKRFWHQASVLPAPDGCRIALDGKPVRLPGGGALAVRSEALAEAIAAEWQAIGTSIMPEDVPLTGLAGAALERIPPQREAMIETLLAYARNDLLCYRATDAELAEAQHQSWQVWLDWSANELGAPLFVTKAIIAIDQPEASLAALRARLAAQDDYALAGLGVIIPATGSLVLGLAVVAGRLAPEDAHRLAILEESFQAARWGEDEEALRRRQRIAGEIATAARFVTLSRS
jgi:chaperone required for assembly of F1-ATPase